jgi:hypothetical protein
MIKKIRMVNSSLKLQPQNEKAARQPGDLFFKGE